LTRTSYRFHGIWDASFRKNNIFWMACPLAAAEYITAFAPLARIKLIASLYFYLTVSFFFAFID